MFACLSFVVQKWSLFFLIQFRHIRHLYNSLKRRLNLFCIICTGFENTYATTTEGRGSPIPRTGSPERSGSPHRMSRGASPIRFDRTGEINALDVDPEAVRMALRDFVQQLAGAERERVSIHS